jgi:hypothetical protein
MLRRTLILSVTAALAVLATTSAADARARLCGSQGYSYAGISAIQSRSGISAAITALNAPHVSAGHVAAWVGVGGYGLGPGESNEWLQAGISAAPGQPVSLYYELAQPHKAPVYHLIPITVSVGKTYDVAVLESRHHPNWWRVWVNGARASARFFLPASRDNWKPVATSENYDGGVGACNTFAFKFGQLRATVTDHRGWTPVDGSVLSAPGYTVQGRTLAGFVARGGV